MRRDYRIYLNDILESIRRIEKYTKSLTFEEFVRLAWNRLRKEASASERTKLFVGFDEQRNR